MGRKIDSKKITQIPDDEGADNAAFLFAKKLAEQAVHDPAGKKSRRKIRNYTVLTKEDVNRYLQAPSSNEKELRNASIFLYQISPRYRHLINYYASIPCWAYTILPAVYNPDKSKPEAFKKQYIKACHMLEAMRVKKTMRQVVITALREGAFYGCIWSGSGDSFILQKLDPDNCIIVSITDGGVFHFQYNMSTVKEKDLDSYYPPQFTDMYNAYVESGEKYQLVPPEISFCFKADPTVIEYSIPVFSGILPTLYKIKNIEDLDETSEELANYKLLTLHIPVDDDGAPTIDYDTAMQYYRHLEKNVADRVGIALTPFDIKDHSFEQSGSTAQIDSVARANENFFAAAGTSALLHGVPNNTSGTTKLAIKVDESFAFGLMYQCEVLINHILRGLSGSIKFKIKFLDVSIFNRDEKIEEYRAAMNYGVGKLELISAMGIDQLDIYGKSYIENDLLDLNSLFEPMRTATQTPAEDSKAGRSEESDEDITDSGESTRDGDKNDNR